MTKYKIYLTKSHEVATLLCAAYRQDIGKCDVKKVSSGYVGNNELIPAIYHWGEWFYCAVESESKKEEYTLIVA